MEKYSKIQKKKKMANPFRKERKNGWKFRLVALLPDAADGIYNGKTKQVGLEMSENFF